MHRIPGKAAPVIHGRSTGLAQPVAVRPALDAQLGHTISTVDAQDFDSG